MLKKSTKNMYIYSAYDLKGNLICEGTANFVADMLGADINNICMNSIQGSILFGEFKITRRLNSLVGNSYMTMLKDIEVNGTNKVLCNIVESLERLIAKIRTCQNADNYNGLLEEVISSDVCLDELLLLLNFTNTTNLTHKEIDDLKREYLKPVAVELDKSIGGLNNV